MNADGATLLIRADAGPRIGTGHVMRTLALAQAWQDAGGRASFVTAADSPAIRTRLEADGFSVVRVDAPIGSPDDVLQTISVAREQGARWIVLDGYRFTSDAQKAIKQAGFPLLWIDDNGDAAYYYADVVLNQNLCAEASHYSAREPYTQLLLGTEYVMLRREFLKWRGWTRPTPPVAQRVLLTLGGSDPDNLTLRLVEAMQHIAVDGLEAILVIGPSNNNGKSLNAAARASTFPIHVETNPANMPELMAWADVAISGAGTTCWELAFLGLPNLLIVLAENQRRTAECLADRGVSWLLPAGLSPALPEIGGMVRGFLRDSQRRTIMSCNGRALIDGQGAARVVEKLRAIS